MIFFLFLPKTYIVGTHNLCFGAKIKITLRSFKSSEHINERGNGILTTTLYFHLIIIEARVLFLK